ncbi:MAG: bacillithiol biosynthesis deacetylase BshB1 [Bacillota bacterium]
MTVLDLLAFGAHPDDVEIGAGGILAGHARRGYSCGIIDLTAGEMASNGTVPQRQAEAREAAGILKCGVRECLGLPDARLAPDRESVFLVAAALRRWQPRVVLSPYFQGDRHPDHNAAGELLGRAVFLAGLRKLPIEGEPFRPQRLYYYLLTVDLLPDMIIDISSVYTLKEQALDAHHSQFGRHDGEMVATPVNDPGFRRHIRNRDAYFGSLAGVAYGEGLIFNTKPLVTDLIAWSELK